jgi:transcriptional regulator NrdR family protein
VACHAIFTTEEAVDLSGSVVVRHSHSPVEPFSRDTLFASILRAVGHRKTPVEDAGALCTTIIAKLLESGAKASLRPADIIVATTDTLQYFDEAAAVQYAAYHRGSS